MKRFDPKEFPLSEDVLYLNHAAVAPWPRRTSNAVIAFAEENCRLGARDYPNWLAKETELRKQLQQLLNTASIDDIALVKNTSEGLSFVAAGLQWSPGDNIVSSNEEFPSNRIPWEALGEQGVEFRQADLYSSSSPEDSLFELVDEHTRLITISSIQFATGTRLDLQRIGQFCKDRGILYCIDAIQSLGAISFDARAYHADFVMADGHKWMLGPEGLGVFYTSKKARDLLKVSQYGWHMIEEINNYDNCPWVTAHTSRKFECGSSNMLGIHALSASLSLLLETGLQSVEEKVLDNTRYLTELINQRPALRLLSSAASDLSSGIVLFRHKSEETGKLFSHLKFHGVVCAQRGGGIRFSPHFYTPRTVLNNAMSFVDSYSAG